MGLILPQTIKVKTSKITCEHYREKGYEFEKKGDFIEVNVLDLYPGTSTKVKCICDVCSKEIDVKFCYVFENNKNDRLITCNNPICVKRKIEDTCTKKYGEGIINPFQAKSVKEKSKQTLQKKYGVDSPAKSSIVQNKMKATNSERYGCEHAMQNKKIQNKAKETNLKRHGCENVMQNKKIQNKARETCKKKYGVDNPSKAQEVKDKKKETCQEHYGVDHPAQAQEVQEAIKTTCRNKYGCDYALQNEEIQNKIKETCKKKYGAENSFGSKEIQNKSKKTWQKNYGEDIINPGQAPEVKDKIFDSFQFNGTGPSSRAQRYICYILNGILNKNICSSLVDIYMEKENIIIEYDGSGHFLKDKMNGNLLPTKKSLLYEKQREDRIINNGYRMIRFIAAKERIPSDKVILNLINEFKNSSFKVIRIDFEEGTIEKDYNEKMIYNFGKLRRITKKNLEPFEKQEEDTSKISKN